MSNKKVKMRGLRCNQVLTETYTARSISYPSTTQNVNGNDGLHLFSSFGHENKRCLCHLG